MIIKAQIESTNICNFDCPLCPRKILKLPIKQMNFSLYRKVLFNLKKVNWLDLTGWGEPLSHPRIAEMISEAKKNGKKVSLTTNASLLRGQVLNNILKSKIDFLTFSLDSVSKNILTDHNKKTAIRNIGNFQKLKTQTKTKVQITLINQSQKELESIINFCAENGIMEVNLCRLEEKIVSGKKNIKDEEKVFYQLRKFAKTKKVSVKMYPYDFGKFPQNLGYKIGGKTLYKNRCPKPRFSIYINVNGQATPCCNLPHLEISDATKSPIGDILNSAKRKKFFKNEKKHCQGCRAMLV